LGSQNAAGIVITTFVATLCSTLVAIFAARFFSKLPRFQEQWHRSPDVEKKGEEEKVGNLEFSDEPRRNTNGKPVSRAIRIFIWGFYLIFFFVTGPICFSNGTSKWFGFSRKKIS